MTNPFAPLFMRYALLAILLIGPMYALLGTMVVSRGMTFFSESLGHGALCGVAIGSILGFTNSLPALVIFGILYALVLHAMQEKASVGSDALIGVLSSLAIALGVVLLSRGGGFSKFTSLLVGDLLAIAPNDLWILAAALLGIVVYWCVAYNKLVLLGASSSLAHSRGVPVRILQLSFTLLVAVVVMLSIRYVGTLIINAMLVLPAAAARNATRNMRSYQLFAIIISVVCGVLGLIASFYLGTASGATIVLLLGVVFIITLPSSKKGV